MSYADLPLIRDVFGSSVSIAEAQTLTTLEHSSVVRLSLNHGSIQSVIVKTCTDKQGLALARREKRFYEHVAPNLPVGICPACYHLIDDGKRVVIILEDILGGDLSDPPSKEQLEAFVVTLAWLHAAARNIKDFDGFWSTALTDHPYNHIVSRLDAFAARRDRFLASHSSALAKDEIAHLYALDRLQANLATPGDPTIVHGDAHFGNGIMTKAGVRIIDWANVALGPGEVDLAHLLALNLPRSHGRKPERRLLDAYAKLLEIDDRKVMDNYKAGVLYAVTSAIGMWEFGVPKAIWTNLFKNAMDAAHELRAWDILNAGLERGNP